MNSGCQYDREQGTLLLRCASCSGDQDLASRSCLNSALRVLSDESGAERMVLCGAWEISYGETALDIMKDIAEVIRFIKQARISNKRFDKCDQCPVSPYSIFSEILGVFPRIKKAEDIHYHLVDSENTKFACEECLASSRENVTHINRMMESIQKKMMSVDVDSLEGDDV